MRVLLDTQVLIWLASGDERRLSRRALRVFVSAEALFFSIASYWELCIKRSLGKVDWNAALAEAFDRGLRDNGIEHLALTRAHCETMVNLPQHHRDPFDRILIAQANVEELALLSANEQMRAYDVNVLW